MPQGIRKGVIFNSIGIFSGTALLLVFNITAARILGPGGYGLLNILYSLVLTITPLLSRGIRDCIVKFISEYEAKEDKPRIFSAAKNGLIALTIFLVIFLAISFFLKDSIQYGFFDADLFLFFVFIFSVILHAGIDYVMGIFQGFREFKYNAFVVIALRLLMVICLVLAIIILGCGVKEASISLLVAPLIALLLAAYLFLPLKKRYVRSGEQIESQKFWGFMIPVALVAFFNMFMLRSGPIIIKALGKADANMLAGLYSGAFTLISPIRMGIMALLESLFPHLSRVEALQNTRLMRRYINRSGLIILSILLILISGYSLLGPKVVQIVYGKNFELDNIHFLLIALLTSSYLLALFLTRILLAKGYAARTLIAFTVSAVVLGLFLTVTRCDILIRTEFGLFMANLVACLIMLFMLKIPPRHSRI